MYRIAVAGFQHETNTFSPIPTTLESFLEGGLNAKGMLQDQELFYFRSEEMNNATSGFMRCAETLGMECIPLLWTESEPSSQVPVAVFDPIFDLFAEKLKAAGPLDGIFLDLHGAMIIAEALDGEAEFLRRLRALVGEIPIVCALDLHANLSSEAVQLASVLVGYRTYPHIDCFETGVRCAKNMAELLEGRNLSKAFRQVPFIIPTSSQDTNQEPCRQVYAELEKLESEKACRSASVLLGFPPGDIECCGPSVVVYAETQDQAEQAADRLLGKFMEIEEQCFSRLVPLDEAVKQALEISKDANLPVILADVQDNPGGGSGSDGVEIIRGLLEAGAEDVAAALLYDPQATEKAHEAGEGNLVNLDLGGKILPGAQPLSGIFRVEKLFDGIIKADGPMAKGMTIDLGKLAFLKIGGIYISVSSKRIQAADQAVFRMFGLDPAEMKILVLKSFIHFRAAFGDICSSIINVEAPGAEFDDPAKAAYRHLREGIRLGGKGPAFRHND